MKQEIIWKIFSLLPTIDEALRHMLIQLNELRLEESSILFKDTAEGIGSITNSLLPLLTEETAKTMLPHTTELRQGISQVADAYEAADMLAIQSALTTKLIPAFNSWQEEIGKQGKTLS